MIFNLFTYVCAAVTIHGLAVKHVNNSAAILLAMFFPVFIVIASIQRVFGRK